MKGLFFLDVAAGMNDEAGYGLAAVKKERKR